MASKYADYLPLISTAYDSYNAAQTYKKKTGQQGYVGLSRPVETTLDPTVAKQIYENMPWYQKSLDAITGGYLFKSKVSRIEDLQAKARNSTGLGGEGALKKSAEATQAIMNLQLNQNIAGINNDYGMAGRYASGARLKAIGAAQNSENFNLANVVQGMSLQSSQFQQNLAEQHAQYQAYLDSKNPSTASQVGDILQTAVGLYSQNPDAYNKMLGVGGNNNLYATSSTEPTLQDTTGMQINPNTEQYGVSKPSIIDQYLGNYKPQLAPAKSVPSFMQSEPQNAQQWQDMYGSNSILSGQNKPVSQWTEPDFIYTVNSIPTNNSDFHSSVTNYQSINDAIKYVINNNLAPGQLADILTKYQASGYDINVIVKWLQDVGGVDVGTTLQNK